MLQRVVRSTVIDAPIERVWAVLRDFNSHDQWHDVVDQSRIEGGESSAQVGCVRNFTLKDGNHIREQLLALSDSEYKSTYCIVEATVPLQRYVATVTLKPVTDGNRTFWHWESTFDTPPGRERELRDMVAQGVYEAGFANLRRHLLGGARHAQPREAAAPTGEALTARQIRLSSYGGADRLTPADGEAPPPGPGQVRIRQRVVGVNFIDVYMRRGWLPGLFPLPGTLGMEAAGTVLDVGEGVSGLLSGDRVAYLWGQPGAYCNLRTVPAEQVLRLPPEVEDEQAAALLLKGLTADYLLHDLGRVRPGMRVLVHAAAGGVGLLVSSWARALGAQVMGTVSSEAKARIAREFGCEQVIVSPDYRFAQAARQHFGDGADLIIDGLGEAAREENLAALARCGHWVNLGQASGPLAPIDPDALLAKSATFSRPVVFDYVATRAQLSERAQRLWRALAEGRIRVPPIERFALDAAARAHERLESRGSAGPLVLLA
ncbi:SRPBCC family protein [Variovorax dokdonensis]|uniref:SRPBCC family protein n=1 Tax=Variovorax dokdonensis TaxID=344883 RepID=A0ABT7N833_9BURK|nr:SRPBCC family protein [Variovorax dokdonensis]MDM0044030.1 SRPBCC family protein [Variovorax dokdonensis]